MPFLLLDPGSGMGKKSGSGMNNPNHISENFRNNFLVKILKFFDADSRWKIRIRGLGWKKLRSGIGINISDPQHCHLLSIS
jgi:hypothetical protein